jgi:hypothetical protein
VAVTGGTDLSIGGASAPGRLRTLLAEPTLPILLLATVAMVHRRYLPDILIFGGTTALVLADAGRWGFRTRSAEPVEPTEHRWASAAALLVAAAGMASLPRTSHTLDLACAVPGVVALGAAWRPGPAEEADQATPAPRRWWLWPTLGVLLALVELWSFLLRPQPLVDDPNHPELSTLVEPHLDPYLNRALFLWAWLLAGWWLLRRIRAWAR